jgi:ribosome-binding factor A
MASVCETQGVNLVKKQCKLFRMKTNRDDTGRFVRLLRVAEQIRHALADVLARGEIRDDVLSATIVSVSEVRVSPDLRHATAFVKPLGGGDDAAVLKALRQNTRYLRGEVARRVNSKYAADLHFEIDVSYDEASRIDALLRSPQVARDLGE